MTVGCFRGRATETWVKPAIELICLRSLLVGFSAEELDSLRWMSVSDDEARTYSIWWFLVAFVAMVGFGIYAVIAWGTYAREPTEELPDTPATTAAGATTTSSSVPVTMVDGSPAPEGVIGVLGEPSERVYLFGVPEEWKDEATDSVVPPVEIERGDDGRTLTVAMGCAVSAESTPAMIRVTEDPFEVNVTPVVIGLRFGAPCAADQQVSKVSIVLDEPVGKRRLVVARPGAQVDVPDLE